MNRNEMNRTRTKEDIRHMFIEQLQTKGIDAIRISDLCKNAKVSKSNFYNYYDDKYAVLEEIENELLKGVAELNKNAAFVSLKNHKKGEPFPLFYETAEYIHMNGIYFKALLGPNGDPSFIFRWKKQMKADIRANIVAEANPVYDPDILTELIASAIVGLYTFWLYEKPALSSQEISEIGERTLFGSLYNYT